MSGPNISAVSPEEFQKRVEKAVGELLPSAEQMYFDSVVHLAVGPFVSKISFATQGALDNGLRSITTIAIPTNVLTDLAGSILTGFSEPAAVDQLASGQKAFIQAATQLPKAST